MTGWVCLTTTSFVDGQARKLPQQDRPHKPWREANRCAQCGKSARWVRCGGGWKRIHGSASKELFQGTLPPPRPFVSLTNVQRSISAATVDCKGHNYPLPLTAADASGVPFFQCVSAR